MRKIIIKTVAIAVGDKGSKFLSIKAKYDKAAEGQENFPGEELQFSAPNSKELIHICNGVDPLKRGATGNALLINGTEVLGADEKPIAGTGLLALNGDRDVGFATECIDPVSEEAGDFPRGNGEIVPILKLKFTRGATEVAI